MPAPTMTTSSVPLPACARFGCARAEHQRGGNAERLTEKAPSRVIHAQFAIALDQRIERFAGTPRVCRERGGAAEHIHQWCASHVSPPRFERWRGDDVTHRCREGSGASHEIAALGALGPAARHIP